jgi:hypothetical protein
MGSGHPKNGLGVGGLLGTWGVGGPGGVGRQGSRSLQRAEGSLCLTYPGWLQVQVPAEAEAALLVGREVEDPSRAAGVGRSGGPI